jgi:pilus assembly protein CpaC
LEFAHPSGTIAVSIDFGCRRKKEQPTVGRYHSLTGEKPIEKGHRKSMALRTAQPVKRTSIGNPDIADFVLISPREIYLNGKAAGTTNLMLWKNGTVAGIYDLEVNYDLSSLKEQLHQLLSDETGLKVFRVNDTITLSGTVSNSGSLSRAMALARS